MKHSFLFSTGTSILKQILHCFGYCSPLLSFGIRTCKSSDVALFFEIILATYNHLQFYMNFRMSLSDSFLALSHCNKIKVNIFHSAMNVFSSLCVIKRWFTRRAALLLYMERKKRNGKKERKKSLSKVKVSSVRDKTIFFHCIWRDWKNYNSLFLLCTDARFSKTEKKGDFYLFHQTNFYQISFSSVTGKVLILHSIMIKCPIFFF